MLKCQFHVHAAGDPVDYITHTAKQLISQAAKLGYEVLAITCHRKLLFNKELKKYAEKHNILLIPAIEFEINEKHILGINVDKEIESVNSFEKLKEYRQKHPDCLIIAPHPFFPGKITLKDDLEKNIELFDAIEHSFCYTTWKNYNNEALAVAQKYNKAVISTSDCHILRYLDLGYTKINCKKDIKTIIKTIKNSGYTNDKVNNQQHPISVFLIAKMILQQILRNIFKPKIGKFG